MPLADVPLPDVPLADVPLADVPLADVPLAVVPVADELLLVDAAPKTPPLTEAGTVVSFAMAAEALKAASVFGPLELSKD